MLLFLIIIITNLLSCQCSTNPRWNYYNMINKLLDISSRCLNINESIFLRTESWHGLYWYRCKAVTHKFSRWYFICLVSDVVMLLFTDLVSCLLFCVGLMLRMFLTDIAGLNFSFGCRLLLLPGSFELYIRHTGHCFAISYTILWIPT